MSTAPTVQGPAPEHRRRISVHASDGTFLLRAGPTLVDRLLASGAAEWRGPDLRIVGAGCQQSIMASKVATAIAAPAGDRAAGGGAR